MRWKYGLLALFLLVLWPSAPARAEDGQCPSSSGVALQVLGSGGPIADDGRASSAYLVWIDGKARVLVDAGGGSFLRFGESGARFTDLDLIALSHFHTDHSADLPALLKSGYFSDRSRPLDIAGPGAFSETFPGLEAFVLAMIGPGQGAYRYLSGYLDGSGGLVKLRRGTVDPQAVQAAAVFENSRLSVSAIAVPHGIVPSIAYRVDSGPHSIVFASDQNGSARNFPAFARDADLLLAHLAIPESATGAATKLHARPSGIGRMARNSGAKMLVLSHFMARSLRDLENAEAQIRLQFSGPVVLAHDLFCINLPDQGLEK